MKISKNSLVVELIIFSLLLLLAVVSRFWLTELPNFKPIAAIALLSGFFFSRVGLAVALPCLAMLISDGTLGTYERPIMLAVYGSLAICPLIGYGVGRWCKNRSVGRWGQSGLIFGSAIGMSLFFFVATNLAVWSLWYEASAAGMVVCFAAAIPFFKFTLLGNVAFSIAGLVSVWAVKDTLMIFGVAPSEHLPYTETSSAKSQ